MTTLTTLTIATMLVAAALASPAKAESLGPDACAGVGRLLLAHALETSPHAAECREVLDPKHASCVQLFEAGPVTDLLSRAGSACLESGHPIGDAATLGFVRAFAEQISTDLDAITEAFVARAVSAR
jgi:hypothetical protein